jgi:hypothetical protein
MEVAIIGNTSKYSISTKDSISIPIPISKINSREKNLAFDHLDEYNLTCNNFDPGKMSPPDQWKNRLEQRLIDLYEIKSNSE